jgi:hypothetical protein
VEVAPIPPADQDILQAFLEEYLLGGHPVGSLNEELASVSDDVIAAFIQQIGAFLGSGSLPATSTSRSELLARLAKLLDSVSLLDGHQSSRGEVTIARSRPDGSDSGDALRVASPRKPGWQPRSTVADALGKSKDAIAHLVDELRREKIAELQAQGLAADVAEKLVQQEYIAFHERPMHRRPRFGYTDLSLAAVHDLAARVASQASWSGNRKLAGLLRTNPQTTRDLAHQCRARKIAEAVAQGLSAAEAEHNVQKNYLAISTHRSQSKIQISPEACRDIAEALRFRRNVRRSDRGGGVQ